MKKGIIIFVVIVLLLVAGGFYQYRNLEQSGGTQTDLSILTTTFDANDMTSDMQQVQELLSILGQVSTLAQLDTGIFNHPSYQALRDFSITLFPAENIGRPNPFLGIGQSASVATPSLQNVSISTDTSVQNTPVSDQGALPVISTPETTSDASPNEADPFAGEDTSSLFDQLYAEDGVTLEQ